ncbi:hypothetical protein Patl1_17229 [Pistacia atlantica]|uniref:Uncharacterized protein n=1 Tax=Pistacia atlantica TaxID=434234 RepID=A0ACC1B5R2_9ROSI|nr:hypothetical protein Patl1_17229 [Pistacia atlantica]
MWGLFMEACGWSFKGSSEREEVLKSEGEGELEVGESGGEKMGSRVRIFIEEESLIGREEKPRNVKESERK